ncbi:PDZ and LIM domain protein Zasp isoform X8 [Drosophila eugracilis]|uniref:PDZ and LIM domain protein Zasp isoform X8 n=1 Tax=Drosophila eugracilis TaxID=29029 RepID=UPI0007E847E2|nr:PDZ and LIM domain protein Zasp isoform X8 [Drosophila eugracilis]
MAQPQLLQVKLSRFDAQPWGFRLQGGTDFAQPLLVQKVNAGSLSEQAGLQPGDAVVKINDVDVFNLRHKDAQDIVVRSGNNFVITVQRGGSTWRPHVTPTGNVPQPNSPYLQTVTKTSLAHKQQDSQHIGCGYNNAARPFSNGGDGGVKSIVNKQYNTPVGIYSDESIAETLSAQAEVLAGGVLGVNFKKNEKEYQGDRSEVLKFLREEETGQSTPEPHSPANFYWTQSHAIGGNERRTPLHHQHQQLPLQQQQPDERIGVPLQSNTLAPEASHRPSLPVAQKDKEEQTRQDQEQADPRIIVMPICPTLQGPEYKAEMEAAAAALAIDQDGRPRPLAASGHPACQLCGVGIVGVFVRIKDKNLHVECFKCATCGTSLKNQGYYNFNNKLYCDIHAKQAAINNPPSGTEGYVPVPIKPNTKLSASTISSALNSHGYGGNSNGYSNGNSAPAPAPPESESSQELPLPPPPSPTQLLQYEAEQLQQVPPEQHLSTTQQQQHQHKQEHTRTHSSLSSISSGSSSSGVGGSGSGSGSGSGVGQSQQSYSSTLSLDRFGSPMHSRQTSGSSTSLEAALAGPAAGQGDNYTMQPPSPPPPPPPQTQSVTNYRLQAAQNENDMNTQNKSPNAYNQLLKEYSNKLQQQHHNTTQHTTATATPAQRHNNTAKPFGVAATTATATATTTPTPHQHLPHQQHQQQPLVAALTATLANQLKFNPHQVASPQATATVATSAATPAAAATAAIPATPLLATATDTPAPVATSDNMSAYVADEPSSIYGQINTNSGAVAPPPQASIVAGGSDQPFEYVTLTGNVIRSVQAPGKGAGPSYKVNQGYARPFGAAAPKSPVSYPPQQQQQSPRPAPGGNNPYATLPRSNVGQQVPPATSTAFAPAPATAPAPAPAPAPVPLPVPVSTPVRLPAIAVQSSQYSSQFDAHELIEETAEELEHSEVLFPPPSPLSHLTKQGKAVQSGLHKPESIPKYQRNWTVLPTQSPIRTPEPQELRENVPLAFVDAPKAPVTSDSSTVHRPIAIAQNAAPTTVVAPSREKEKERRPQMSVPIIVEDRSGPVTMAFQPLDELVRPDQALTPTRPYTPSLTNKPAPIVPFYQTEEKLVFEECSATHARNYNELNASPFPDRTRSPAPGPPPNPLNAIRAPRMKEPEPKSTILSVSGAPRLQTGSITTGQSYQGQLLAHSEQSSQSASQSFTQQPQRITEQRVGNLNIQQREQSSQLQQQAQSQSQSQTRSQVGNTQIERRRKVTEEFERTQSAKTIEIRTGSQSITQSQGKSQSISQAQAQSQSQNQSDTERRSSYGKTGFVANQAKRLSCLEQEISSLTSQSQAISARASALGEGCFPNLRSPTFDSKFPLKPAPVESTVPGYGAVPAASNKLMAPPPGFLQQQQLQQQQKSAFSGYQATTSSVQQSSYASSSKATSSSLSSSSASASASASVARSSQSLTQASAITTTTNNQATTAYRSSNGSNIKPNLASRPSIASITGSANAPAPAPAPFAAPIKATAPFKTPIAPKSVIANAVNAAAPPAPAVFPPDLSDLNLNSNVPDSPGAGGKSAGAFGATSAPKRGRGILNKAAGPGVRIPLCNSCNVQIRGPFITALGRIWCPDHFICVNGNCRRPLQDIGFVEEKGDLYCEYCFEKYLAPTCSKCAGKIKGDCLNAIGKHFHPECFTCGQCGKIFGNRPFFLEDGNAYCEADWNELFTTKCFACGFPVEAGDRWVEALNHNYHSQCFNCTFCKQNLEGQSFYNKGGRPFCKNHAR